MDASVWKKSWEDFKAGKAMKNTREFIELNLKFDYSGRVGRRGEKKKIVDALVFWKFIRDHLINESWETRRDFLKDFIALDEKGDSTVNHYIIVVTTVESLPDSLWRKILWKYNLDFMSFESFLRRLNPKQLENIIWNYRELFVNNEIPEAFGWFDRYWKKVSVDTLLAEEINPERRYQSKGAISYNLLGLDFGFNAFPKGVSNDTKVVEISPLRFLSKKMHADDFVVKQEDGGKYWWLYQKARSNYVYKPNRDIELKDHVCPGFWYTFIIHSLFWVFSPLAVVSLTLWQPTSSHEWWRIALNMARLIVSIPLSIFTPLWLLAAGTKLTWKFLIVPSAKKFWKFADSRIFAWEPFVFLAEKLRLKKFHGWAKEKNVYGALLTILIGIAFTIFASAVLNGIGVIVKSILAALAFMNIHWIILVTISGWIAADILLWRSKRKGETVFLNNLNEEITFLRTLALYFAAASLGVILWSSSSQAYQSITAAVLWLLGLVADFFVSLTLGLVHFLAAVWQLFGSLIFLILLPFVFLALILWAEKKMTGKKSEIFFDWLDKFLIWLMPILFGVSAILLIVFGGYLTLSLLFWIILLISMFVFAFERSVNPKIARYKEDVDRFDLKDRGLNHRLLLKNRFLEKDGLDIHEVKKFVVILRYFLDENKSKEAARIFTPRLNRKILERFPTPGSEEYEKILYGRMPLDMRFNLLEKIFSGLDFQQAVDSAREDFRRAQAAAEKQIELWGKILGILSVIARKVAIPFVFLGTAIVFLCTLIYLFFRALGLIVGLIVRKAIEIFVTFWRLKYELFNERCPYVSKPRDLSKE